MGLVAGYRLLQDVDSNSSASISLSLNAHNFYNAPKKSYKSNDAEDKHYLYKQGRAFDLPSQALIDKDLNGHLISVACVIL